MTLFARRATVHQATGYSLVDEQMIIAGEINTQGTIRVDGRIEGRVHRAGAMIVGSTGVVVGDVEAGEVVVGGVIEGNIVAAGRVEVQASATVKGDIKTSAMLLHEGGTVRGHMMVDHRQAKESEESPRLAIARGRASTTLNG